MNTDSFVFEMRGQNLTWTPLREVNGRILCVSNTGDKVLFDKVHINHIRFLDDILKRRKTPRLQLSAEE